MSLTILRPFSYAVMTEGLEKQRAHHVIGKGANDFLARSRSKNAQSDRGIVEFGRSEQWGSVPYE